MTSGTLDLKTRTALEAVLELARRGDLTAAIAEGERVFDRDCEPGPMHALLGLLLHRIGKLEDGAIHLRAAAALKPDDITIALNLSTILIETGAWAEVAKICSPDIASTDPSLRLWRMRAHALQAMEDYVGAVVAYRHLVKIIPYDSECWNNLGNAQAALGDWEASIASLEHAIAIQPMVAPVRMNLATTFIAAGQTKDAINHLQALHRDFPQDAKPLVELSGIFKQTGDDKQALNLLKRAVAIDPNNAEMQVKLAVEFVVGWDMEQAEAALCAAIAIDPALAEAHVLLGLLFEHTNRAELLPTLIRSAGRNNVAEGSVSFLRALSLRREGRFEEGLAALAHVTAEVEPVRTAQMRGQFLERLNNPDAAFVAFEDMNVILASDPTNPKGRAAAYRRALQSDRRLVTKQWYMRWQPAPSHPRMAPTFLVGFPRSGTTLLDTLLMGHPNVQVLEECPPLTRVEQALGNLGQLAKLTNSEIERLQEVYYYEVDLLIDRREDAMLIDKSPLHINKVPIIQRIFPGARFILALRHPCDAVLSCFITNFRLNHAMSNFLDLDTTARVYDESFGFWEQCRAIFPVNYYQIRYENIIDDLEGELRPLFDYLQLDWHEEILDHRKTARERGLISTASYAQVTEPIYHRAAGRWKRYRKHLEPVFPILDPWILRYGYTL